ncbi:MAG: hypothetical protein F4064_04930 [Acidimicrobiales bacterium]|nr:hypothetical protein [Acidimicrobiales bacterium]MYI27422.1 hypothetical protein [Acidimicrobiales bacterium]
MSAACALLAAALLAVTAGPALATNDMTITGVCNSGRLSYEVTLTGVGNTPGATMHPDTEDPITFTVTGSAFMAHGEKWELHSNGLRFVSGDKIETIAGSTSCPVPRYSPPPLTPTETKSVAVANAVNNAESKQTGAAGYTAVAQAWNTYCAAVKGCTDTLPTSPAAYCAELGITGTGFKLTGGYVC